MFIISLTFCPDYNRIIKTNLLFLQRKEEILKKFLPVIKRSTLFRGISEEEILAMLRCLQVHVKSYGKKDFIYRNGDDMSEMGLVLSGSVHLIKEDYLGKRSILARIPEGQVFGEVFACLNQKPVNMSIVAPAAVEILYLDRHWGTTCFPSH